jgi:hypothetical protein
MDNISVGNSHDPSLLAMHLVVPFTLWSPSPFGAPFSRYV